MPEFIEHSYEPIETEYKVERFSEPPLIATDTPALEASLIQIERQVIDVDPIEDPEGYIGRRNRILDDIDESLLPLIASRPHFVGGKMADFLASRGGMSVEEAQEMIMPRYDGVRFVGLIDLYSDSSNRQRPASFGMFEGNTRTIGVNASNALAVYGMNFKDPRLSALELSRSVVLHEYIHAGFSSSRVQEDDSMKTVRNGMNIFPVSTAQPPILDDDKVEATTPAFNEARMTTWFSESLVELARTKIFNETHQNITFAYKHGYNVLTAIERYAQIVDQDGVPKDIIGASLEGAILGESVGVAVGRIEKVLGPLTVEAIGLTIEETHGRMINGTNITSDAAFVRSLQDQLEGLGIKADPRFLEALQEVFEEQPITSTAEAYQSLSKQFGGITVWRSMQEAAEVVMPQVETRAEQRRRRLSQRGFPNTNKFKPGDTDRRDAEFLRRNKRLGQDRPDEQPEH